MSITGALNEHAGRIATLEADLKAVIARLEKAEHDLASAVAAVPASAKQKAADAVVSAVEKKLEKNG